MSDQLLMGNLQLYTEPSSSQTSLSVSRTDIGSTSALAQISMFGSGTNNRQGVLALSTMNGAGVLEEKMRIHTNGNVGIGTSMPGAKLDVLGAVRATAFQGDGAGLTSVQDTTKVAKTGDTMTGALNLPSNGLAVGANQLVVSSGNIGIGTTAPIGKLQVSGGAIIPAAGSGETAGIMFPKDPGGGGGDAAWIRYYPRTGEACSLEIGISNDADDHIVLMSSGNVGIGTRTPSDKLDVYGTMRLFGKVAFQGYDNYLRINQDNAFPNGTHFSHRANFFSGLTTGNWWDVEPGVGNLLVQGNIGIGTTAPIGKLQVSGGAIIPAAGSGETAGIMFPKDPGGGGGDAAWIRYYPRTGEACSLEIGISNDANDHIALMSSGNVGIGTATPDAKLEVVGGDIHMEAGRTFYSHGRMHIYGEELLYLLNKSGVVIGKEWNGNGNLKVEGSLSTDGSFHVNPPEFEDAIYITSQKWSGSLWRIFRNAADAKFEPDNKNHDYGLCMHDCNTRKGVTFKNDGGIWLDSPGTIHQPSDKRLKKNIKPLSGALKKLLLLKGKTFEWKEPGISNVQIGFIGQDVEKVFPEWVDTDHKGVRMLTTNGLGALTVEAIRELKDKCTALTKRLDYIESARRP